VEFTKNLRLFPSLILIMRVLLGIGWLLAGYTKINQKLWFKEPGILISEYLLGALQSPNVPAFYKLFIENIALEYVLFFNYVIPITQIIVGIFLIVGLFTIPSILVCLFMHINFILSGNMNLISLILYTNAFSLIIFKRNLYLFSLDRFFNLDKRKTSVTLSSKTERLLSN
jgi:thiosulfate dehydrogenase [quinone] large subunit